MRRAPVAAGDPGEISPVKNTVGRVGRPPKADESAAPASRAPPPSPRARLGVDGPRPWCSTRRLAWQEDEPAVHDARDAADERRLIVLEVVEPFDRSHQGDRDLESLALRHPPDLPEHLDGLVQEGAASPA